MNRGHELERREFLKINSGFSGSGKSFLDRALGPGNWSAAHYPRASVLDCWVAQAASLTRAATCRAERRRTFVGFEAADGKSTLPLFRRAGSPCHPVQLRISGSTTTPHRKSARTLAQSKTSRSSNGSRNGGKGLPSDPAGRNIVSFALSRNNAVEMGEHDPSRSHQSASRRPIHDASTWHQTVAPFGGGKVSGGTPKTAGETPRASKQIVWFWLSQHPSQWCILGRRNPSRVRRIRPGCL